MAAKLTIGRADRADFPALGLADVAIKIDTGAYTSSIHCHHIALLRDEDTGRAVLTFRLLDPSHPEYTDRVFRFTEFDAKRVRSSNGTAQRRFVIKGNIRLFGRTRPLLLTLAERGEMQYPVLIGRRFLAKRFLVDVDAVDLSYAHGLGANLK